MYNQRQHFNVGKKAINKCFQRSVPINQLFLKIKSKKSNLLRSNSIFFVFYLVISLLTTGCNSAPKETAQATSKRGGGATAIDAAIARKGQLKKELSYTGTTIPFQKISVRSQIEGQLLALYVYIGYIVTKVYIL